MGQYKKGDTSSVKETAAIRLFIIPFTQCEDLLKEVILSRNVLTHHI